MVNDFCELNVWKEAKRLAVDIYKLTRYFPKEEMYGLTSQLRRSSTSICANIAEGFSRFHAKDKIRFYYNARGSISESKSHVHMGKDLQYISPDIADKLLKEFEAVKMMLNGSNCLQPSPRLAFPSQPRVEY